MSPSGPLEINNRGDVWLPQSVRPRRNRKKWAIRRMLQENSFRVAELIYPLFVHDQEGSLPIDSMPGCSVHSIEGLLKEVKEAMDVGVYSFMLFPRVSSSLKHRLGHESYNPNGLIPTAVTAVKSAFPEAVVCTDVALDPYTDSGHCGIANDDGEIDNDFTVGTLCKQAVLQAGCGADMVCPSDMMDGRVGAIRDALDAEGFTNTSILAYTAKYCSALYGPFRDAVGSALTSSSSQSRSIDTSDPHPASSAPYLDKRSYQMDPSNYREALVEQALDEEEGADILMVKPAYLDVVQRVSSNTDLPVAVYQVSGEYSMLKAAAERGWLDEKKTVLEALKGMKRAGAKVFVTYYAKQIGAWALEDLMGRVREVENVDHREDKWSGVMTNKRKVTLWRDDVNFADLSV
eukprot:GHVQ01025375.1.p1 GENE.GHVQ01025375.1~~GHVQ01025375.1.p1  ORF type:complete len:404 (+),score=64.83 GHVQ01025375.1:1526-2737(+)